MFGNWIPEMVFVIRLLFDLYSAWSDRRRSYGRHHEGSGAARAAMARGEAIFNSRRIDITGVGGLNDELGVAHIAGSCTRCHDTPRAGNHSLPAPLNIGLVDASRRTLDLPLYTLRNRSTGARVRTTDPGRALITGLW